jgi:hypothetical protein
MIIYPNPPLGKGDLKPSFSILAWLRNVFGPEIGFETDINLKEARRRNFW